MILKVTKITILNTQIISNDLSKLDAIKEEISKKFNVKLTEVLFNISEAAEEIITHN